MPGNTFIKFDAVPKGESFQDGHHGDQGWIEIGDWSWDIEAETSFLKGGGASVGKPTPGNLSFSHYYDKASPVIMGKIVAGTAFGVVTIESLKQTGAKNPEIFMRLTMTDVFITKVSSKGGEDGSVNQDVEMVFKKIKVEYKAQTNQGKLESSFIPFEWDIAAMKLLQ
ncbi:type VI secretion system tube protein Hcp [Ideonella sp. 4Y16]|uniref:Type VI secretion system tube protein Hcp n=1 Tax=Ideonella alba TaxID=2824118 RepID=A0A941BDN9_9BURK|nr:type VI secretion system tube protein Hcp [Ideonella alba]MBQ0930376.1 type VI secretion system tube protein Hcp [Ideonella alba]MBQ0946269.1 type VI secretion system tube protein Hcp [Ideonella alba]